MSVVTPTLLSAGKAMDPTWKVLSIDVRREVNRIPRAEVHLLDGDDAKRVFPASDTTFFEPGKEIEIKLRYEGGSDETVFKGLVVRHGVEAGVMGSTLVVEMKDAAVKLTGGRQSAVYRDKSDSDIVGELLAEAGLEKGKIAATKPRHPQIVQHDATHWDFILSRADVQGLLVVVNDGEVSLAEIKVSGSPKHTFDRGISTIYNFEMQADASHQYGAFESVAWSLKDLQLTPATKAKDFKTSQGNLDAAKMARTFGFATRTLADPVPLDPDELQAWADARMRSSRMAMLRGRVAVPGFSDLALLDVMEIDGVGKRFNGRTLVTGLRHLVDGDGWQTDVQFGLSPQWFCAREEVAGHPASGLVPPLSGLRIGLVGAFEEDPDKEYRLRVLLPGIDDSVTGIWARLATPEAGAERGYFFRPEKGDEVIVGFLNDDPRQPVVLGSLYGSKNKPPAAVEKITADNFKKGIVTKKGTLFLIDDEKDVVTITTPKKNTILIDDGAETMQLSDSHGNTVTLNKGGVTIKSAKDFVVEASGNVEIIGTKVDVK